MSCNPALAPPPSPKTQRGNLPALFPYTVGFAYTSMSKGLGSFLGAGTEDDNFTVLVDGNSTGVVEDLVSRTLTGTADADRERSRKPCIAGGKARADRGNSSPPATSSLSPTLPPTSRVASCRSRFTKHRPIFVRSPLVALDYDDPANPSRLRARTIPNVKPAPSSSMPGITPSVPGNT